ncbi:MAG: nodulation protein NfeD [Chloroflexi bacterium]|nr:nodulation protein NfeD [Chloroflexota bacterium]
MSHRLDHRRKVAAALLSLAGLLLAFAANPVTAATQGSIVVLPATGEVDGLMADAIASGLDSAAASGAVAVVLRLDTPGGSLAATQRIVTSLLTAKVPVIVWVAPAGGFAASAGTFITLAANLSFMAPGTRIGAASPIDGSGQDIPGVLGEKVRNDAIAWITSIAEERHRPVGWAASTVAEAHSASASEAVAVGAVDGIAATIDEVVAAANGRTVTVAGHDVVLALTGAPVEQLVSNPLGGLLRLLANPNVAFLLFTAGALALLFEIQNPNVLTGILGLVAIALAAVGFVNLPTDVTGLLLVAIGLVLFALEPAIPSHGLLTVGGAVAFVLGGSALYTQADRLGPAVRVATPLLLVAVVTAAGFGLLIATTAIRTRRMAGPRESMSAPLVAGTPGEVRRPLEPMGSVYARGEEWSARTADERPLPRGTAVRVVGSDGLTVIVEPAPSGLR